VRSWILLSLPVTAAMTVLASSTRGSQIALLVQIVYFAAFFKKLSVKYILSMAGVCYLLYMLLPPEELARFQTAGTDETSVARLTYWKKGMEMLSEHPLSGVGLHNFARYFHDFYGSYSFHNRLEVAHNSFVQVGSELGYPGLILFVVIILRSFVVTAQARRVLRAKQQTAHWLYSFSVGLDCAMIGYCIGGFFMAVAFYPYVWIHIAFVVSLRSAARSLESALGAVAAAEPASRTRKRNWYPSYEQVVSRANSSTRQE
jgi:putative inorganic carbon (hco3(-)) transporter